jgi:hypothetical protein
MISVLTTVLPLLTGFVGGIFKRHLELKAQQMKALIDRGNFEEKSRNRAANLQDDKVSWTRRTIALLFTTSLLFIVVVVTLTGIFSEEMIINVPRISYKDTLFSSIGFTDPKEIKDYVQLQGLTVVAPLLEPVVSAVQVIIGFYFGASRR